MSYRPAHRQPHPLRDPVTGLPNRLLFDDRLEQALRTSQRHGNCVGVGIVTLDESYEPAILAIVAHRLQESVRSYETIARSGEREFLVLFSDVTVADDVVIIGERLRNAFSHPYSANGREHTVHASIGLAISSRHPRFEEAAVLLTQAQEAMLAAQRHGGGMRVFRRAQARHGVRAVSDADVADLLQGALERHELQLHFQPEFDASNNRIVAAEALVRWHPEGRDLIVPDRFIPIAEASGLIVPIGEWMLREACHEAHRWNAAGHPVTVAVNVSATQFETSDVLRQIQRALYDSQLDPHALQIEITETVLMQSPEEHATVLRVLKNMGVQIVIDDFGTGYSSLAYIRQFPLDMLKIDRTFVSSLPVDADAIDTTNEANIVRAIIALANNVGLRVLAEGVETSTQRDFLLRNGCRLMQGYFFGRPQSAHEFRRRLNDVPAA